MNPAAILFEGIITTEHSLLKDLMTVIFLGLNCFRKFHARKKWLNVDGMHQISVTIHVLSQGADISALSQLKWQETFCL